jgi:hypothetical protein
MRFCAAKRITIMLQVPYFAAVPLPAKSAIHTPIQQHLNFFSRFLMSVSRGGWRTVPTSYVISEDVLKVSGG